MQSNKNLKNMKQKILSLLGIIALTLESFAQVSSSDAVTININDMQYVVLSFPATIKYADFGSSDIIGDKISDRVLVVKSTIPNFVPTTASIVTTDGNYYGIRLIYKKQLQFLGINMENVTYKVTPEDTYSPAYIELSSVVTSHIIFDQKITNIIVGCDSIIADKAENIDNIIKAKAISTAFDTTSLTAVLADGTLYPFVVTHNEQPSKTSFKINTVQQSKVNAIFNDASVNDKQMLSYAKSVIAEGVQLNDIGAFSQKMIFSLFSLYIKQDVLMFNVNLQNDNQIDYEIDFIKVYVQDAKRSKTTAIQEDEITPIYVYYQQKELLLKGKSNMSAVLFFKRFTIPQSRILYFEVFEKNGGRHLKFKMTNKDLLKAKQL